ncbi:acetyl-CoA carboxylase biotin carboxylase subunit [Verminephrobacter eiseniae]|nr:acetyl-CoA carboxylase biotin carboxylase subunit [Verminephrobacter eiseniae]MCW5283763.1 acetyl-CoA carboxylase biotin carboxylase subunit [Verminephrobacter eiseniae]MCW5301473.1 acetyl-CoA carboxylase biotin carboxylase subunit [Verminephrobacter eiseniae]MCW8182278.1 acetyl-CoA carboxylase biotin carboxylase subunit [Verminephrobacter eiseniae]MCW8191275.1 acetyl-CoA carboxylase biotin carboxylase subunit [Verminephrobacter eiseniae]
MTGQARPFNTLLVANRGEIAIRIMRTARRLGLRTVAIYSEADRASLHAVQADTAVCVGPAAPRESYLNIEAILQAARRTGADAIHPGYGFLAENGDFAAAVTGAGLVFVGPPAEAIRAMGNKAEAKRLMRAAGMPCVPGYQGLDQGDPALQAAASGIGFPVMVKAAAGGGGRGMRLVHGSSDLAAALASARSEALAAFGSDELILERALLAPRHIEIQVFADTHGHVIHLGERDCSVQRRHQKLIEEAPSPAVGPELRARMGKAAVDAANAIGYVGAGTMEFLLDRSGAFYFMEMNTRLQVEHAVTEAITGLDLVEWQLRVAAGEPLPLTQDEVAFDGHAIEARLTAEDVSAGFLPQGGPVLCWRPPADGHDVRVDHGLSEGAVVPPDYDSMVAKLVAHARTRDEARRKLHRALQDCVLLGVASNQGFLAECLEHPAFCRGDVDTGFIAEHMGAALAGTCPDSTTVAAAALAAAGWPWHGATRLGHAVVPVDLELGRRRWHVQLQAADDSVDVTVRQEAQVDSQVDSVRLALVRKHGDSVWWLEGNGQMQRVVQARNSAGIHLHSAGRAWCFVPVDPRRARAQDGGSGAVTAPLTGRIAAVGVAVGDTVQAGQTLVVLEAMKMEHRLSAPFAGRITELSAQVGGQARAGSKLVQVQPLGIGAAA